MGPLGLPRAGPRPAPARAPLATSPATTTDRPRRRLAGSGYAPAWLHFDTDADGGLRHSYQAVRMADVLAAVESDARLATRREKCRMYAELARFGRGFDAEAYADVAEGARARFPLPVRD